jgi:hypothetical protein
VREESGEELARGGGGGEMWEHGKAAGFSRASDPARETLTARPNKEPLAVAFSYFAAQPLLIFKVS